MSSAPGVTLGLNYFAGDLDDATAFKSAFTPTATAAALHVRVTADASVVPEPAGLSLLLVAAVPLARRWRRS